MEKETTPASNHDKNECTCCGNQSNCACMRGSCERQGCGCGSHQRCCGHKSFWCTLGRILLGVLLLLAVFARGLKMGMHHSRGYGAGKGKFGMWEHRQMMQDHQPQPQGQPQQTPPAPDMQPQPQADQAPVDEAPILSGDDQ